MDVVVTVPKSLWTEWIREGGLPGESWNGLEYHFWVSSVPEISVAERVYIVAHGKLRGYSPLVRCERRCQLRPDRACLIRHNGAVPVTIKEAITGFRGYRYRWWNYSDEAPFSEWQLK